jgi:hypothetical protein
MSGCELLHCRWYVDWKCTDPMEYVTADTGESCCGRRDDAVPVGEEPDRLAALERENAELQEKLGAESPASAYDRGYQDGYFSGAVCYGAKHEQAMKECLVTPPYEPPQPPEGKEGK